MKRSQDDKSQLQTDGHPPQKRSRVSRACDQCRASREKCDGSQPTCGSCATQDRSCTYNEQPKKRGIQPHYIRTLELLLAWFSQSYPDGVLKLAQSIPLPNDPITRLLSAKDADASEDLHQAWRSGVLCRQIDQLLSGSSVGRPDATELRNLSSDLRTKLPPTPQEKGESWESNCTTDPTANAIPEKLTLPENAWKLLEYYFAFTHSWMPLTEKTEILKLMYAYPATGLSIAMCSSPEYAELWAIMALADIQLSTNSNKDKDPDTLLVARTLIPKDSHLVTPGYAKALLLHGLIEFTRCRWLSVWLLVGSVIRLVYYQQTISIASIGGGPLSSPSGFTAGPKAINTPQSATSTSSGMGSVLMLAAFVIENAVAGEAQLPTLFGPNMVTLLEPLREDGPEEWTPWQDPLTSSSARSPTRACSSLNALARHYIQANQRVRAHDATDTSPVVRLTQNAIRVPGRDRSQPFALISQYVGPGIGDGAQHFSTSATRPTPPSQLGFVSIPQGPLSTSTFEESPSMSGGILSNTWGPDGTAVAGHGLGLSDTSLGLDDLNNGSSIFEELALLEKTDSAQHPEFMRNLGFGPDIDLAEFFGADYQPSDPLLAYMQPNFATTLLDDESRSEEG